MIKLRWYYCDDKIAMIPLRWSYLSPDEMGIVVASRKVNFNYHYLAWRTATWSQITLKVLKLDKPCVPDQIMAEYFWVAINLESERKDKTLMLFSPWILPSNCPGSCIFSYFVNIIDINEIKLKYDIIIVQSFSCWEYLNMFFFK